MSTTVWKSIPQIDPTAFNLITNSSDYCTHAVKTKRRNYNVQEQKKRAKTNHKRSKCNSVDLLTPTPQKLEGRSLIRVQLTSFVFPNGPKTSTIARLMRVNFFAKAKINIGNFPLRHWKTIEILKIIRFQSLNFTSKPN